MSKKKERKKKDIQYTNIYIITQRQLARGGQLTEADEHDGGIIHAFSRILRDGEGSADGAGSPNIAALYTGLASDAAKSVLDSFLFFLFYEWFRTQRLHASGRNRGAKSLGVLDELLVGVAAGACSRAFTTPIANVVTRKQTATLVDTDADATPSSVRGISKAIVKERGIKGLWSGYSASLVLTLNPSITFFLQEFLKRSLLGNERWEDPGPRMTFLLAAVSKAVASTITYPFQIAKTRLQAGVPVESEDDAEKDGIDDKGAAENDSAAQRSVDKEVDDKLSATRAVHKFAQQSIFGTIGQIIRTEGVKSLYHGIEAELLKGFFSHGTTMLAKDAVHKLLFKLYFVVAGVLRELQQRREQRGGLVGEDFSRWSPFKSPSSDSHFSRLNSTFWNKKAEPVEADERIVLNMVDKTHRRLGKD